MADPESYFTCPYNPAHRILEKRRALHLIKCKNSQQRTDEMLCECMFNATHKIPESEMQHHLTICPDRINLDKYIYISETVDVNRYPVPLVNVNDEENWDNENTPAYNPEEYCKNNPVVRQKKLQSAAKRKEFRHEERRRIQSLQDMAPINTDKKTSTHRSKPNETAQAGKSSSRPDEDDPYTVEKLQEKVRLGSQRVSTDNPTISKIGRGRGRNIAK